MFGRLRDIAVGPNKEIYIATNSGTHPILRLTPSTPLGVTELQDETSLIVPNPAEIYIHLASDNRAEQVTILDLNGKTVMDLKQVEAGEQIDISRLAPGTYSVEVKFAGVDQVQRQKLMK
jgi:YbbR domain-containing protein